MTDDLFLAVVFFARTIWVLLCPKGYESYEFKEFGDFLSACDGKMDQKSWQWKYLKDLIVMIGIFR